ncbi:hypothetical protein ACLUTX_12430 [Enterobacterales bacterium AE_CKDN230030158-1A_HGKHYDSX7]
MSYETVVHTVKLSTDVSMHCKVCGEWQEAENLDANLNHYLQQHGAKLLHLGSEAYRDENGRTAHHTVAVVGLDEVPPKREPTPFNIDIQLSKKP